MPKLRNTCRLKMPLYSCYCCLLSSISTFFFLGSFAPCNIHACCSVGVGLVEMVQYGMCLTVPIFRFLSDVLWRVLLSMAWSTTTCAVGRWACWYEGDRLGSGHAPLTLQYPPLLFWACKLVIQVAGAVTVVMISPCRRGVGGVLPQLCAAVTQS